MGCSGAVGRWKTLTIMKAIAKVQRGLQEPGVWGGSKVQRCGSAFSCISAGTCGHSYLWQVWGMSPWKPEQPLGKWGPKRVLY